MTKTERQIDRETERQRDRETERIKAVNGSKESVTPQQSNSETNVSVPMGHY